jgi:hypothetical protein
MVCKSEGTMMPEIKDFRGAFFWAADQQVGLGKTFRNRIAAAKSADPKKHKRLWQAMENICIHRYERQTGKKFTTWGDGTILQWLVDNLPAILKIIMSILAMFA